MVDIDEIREQLKEAGWHDGRTYVWIGLRGSDVAQFFPFLPFDAIVCRQDGEDIQEYISDHTGVPVISAERMGLPRDSRHSPFHDRFCHEQAEAILDYLSNDRVLFIPYQSGRGLHRLLFDYGNGRDFRLCNNTRMMHTYFDYKLRLVHHAESTGIPIPPRSSVQSLSSLDYNTLRDRFGGPFVVQSPLASAGRGTVFIDDRSDFQSMIDRKKQQLDHQFDSAEVKITPYLDGPSLNCNGVVTDGKVILSQPNYQIVGPPSLTTSRSQYCGSDFTVSLEESIRKDMLDATRRIGEWLGREGYRGWFGADFLSTTNDNGRFEDVFVSELNPRFCGESHYLGGFQLEAGSIPLSLFHMVPYIEAPMPFEAPDPPFPDLHGGCFIIHSRHEGSAIVNGRLRGGVYRYDKGELSFQRPGLHVKDCEREDEFVITGDIARP
ncbi:MAG: hypothetical protein ABEJ65_11735, partial [bacterium]